MNEADLNDEDVVDPDAPSAEIGAISIRRRHFLFPCREAHLPPYPDRYVTEKKTYYHRWATWKTVCVGRTVNQHRVDSHGGPISGLAPVPRLLGRSCDIAAWMSGIQTKMRRSLRGTMLALGFRNNHSVRRPPLYIFAWDEYRSYNCRRSDFIACPT